MGYIIKNVDVSSFLGLDHLGVSAWLSASSAPGLRKPRFNLAEGMGGSTFEPRNYAGDGWQRKTRFRSLPFWDGFCTYFQPKCLHHIKKTQISQDQNLVDDFFHQKLPDKLPPKPGALRNFAPSKGRRSNLRCHLRPVAKSMNFVSTQPKCSSQISLFFFGLNKGKVKDLGAS